MIPVMIGLSGIDPDKKVNEITKEERLKFVRVAKGEAGVDRDKIEQDIAARDKQDMERKTAPLKRADDAILVDSSDMGIEEVAAQIIRLANERK